MWIPACRIVRYQQLFDYGMGEGCTGDNDEDNELVPQIVQKVVLPYVGKVRFDPCLPFPCSLRWLFINSPPVPRHAMESSNRCFALCLVARHRSCMSAGILAIPATLALRASF
jgi:hypothetical protein